LLRALVVAATFALAGCAAQPAQRETLLSGETMGSAWTVKIAGRLPASADVLNAGAQARFDAVNLALSTYRADSALTRFNDDQTGEWLDIDPELYAVLAYALSLAQESGGTYDVTVGPLVNLWGFGPDPATQRVPEKAAIEAARARVGFRKVEIDAAGKRARKPPDVRVDLSSLGKGRGVDRVAEFLDAQGLTNYLIDLSGKLRARGTNAQGGAWRVAVEQPIADATSAAQPVEPEVMALRDESVATAGDYRRFFEAGGQHYSHIIDPRSGWPVTHSTVSATAIAADCMQADALATVMMVMPPEEAMRLANRLQWQALLISHGVAGYRVVRSVTWPTP
jgi:thiamine biosynthesis lipoprotein